MCAYIYIYIYTHTYIYIYIYIYIHTCIDWARTRVQKSGTSTARGPGGVRHGQVKQLLVLLLSV